MAAIINQEEKGLYFQIQVVGEFTVKSLRHVREAVEAAENAGHQYLAFNMSEVDFIDSSGIGLIMNVHKNFMSKGGRAFLIGTNRDIHDTIRVSGITKAIQTFKDEEEADGEIG